MSRTVFVTGASGVLGRRVVPSLVAAGHQVTANVRSAEAAGVASAAGASVATVDLFDEDATMRLAASHDTIVHVATSIPTGSRAAWRSAWATNDRLRSTASANLAAAMSSVQGRYVGESITFPYVDNGDDWIDETQPRTYFWGNRSCADAEAASDAVTRSGGSGVALRFAMFFADDSAHVSDIRAFARRGVFPLPGRLDGRGSWIHIDDAAAAVVAAIDAPTGVYNVAEPSPVARREHAAALAIAVGRKRLRSIPAPLAKLGGAALESLGRSQRISSRALTSATGWVPERSVVDCWAG